MGVASMKLAIEEFMEGARTPEAVQQFLDSHQLPIVRDGTITFLWRGEADAVHLRHWIYGLASSQDLQRIDGTDLWHLSLPLPPGSRVEYKFEIVRDGQGRWIRDPFNPNLARDPFGANSVAHGEDYSVPEWAHSTPESAPGSYKTISFPSEAFGRRVLKLYLPARFRTTRRYPLLIVHDGEDYLNYASLGHVLDNLMARREIPDMIVALTNSPNRLVEYANDERHARFITEELVPFLEDEFPLRTQPQSRCLMGASFGGVAALSTACRYPGFYGRLLLQSGSFAFSDIGEGHRRSEVFDPVVKFMNQFRAQPSAISERVFVSCGMYESLIYENRSLIPLLKSTGMNVRYREARDGHNWENWRDRLREGLSWLFPGAFLMMYE